MDKIIHTRIQQKHDTPANWAANSTFVPKNGEMIVYDEAVPRIKIGNGETTIGSLPFITDNYYTKTQIEEKIAVTRTLENGILIATINGVNIYAPAYTNGDNLTYGGNS